ncbi:hypothetical protein ACJ73_08106 [Blastomyces percursus]|uniref:Uncharacterized protein n=1 Tax=Blastomyces percursus TaxID=1658174 RepID=A0A1J9PW26_9EURO|nr:hypothetical protein ACJ73_08106 [Blastomyces percursus]
MHVPLTTFIFKTTNPDTQPLPSFEFLEMQWHLQRIVSMSGAAEIYDDDIDDDDDNWGAGIVCKPFSDILAWVPPPLFHSAGDNNEPDPSLSSVSISPSPPKTIEHHAKNLSAGP